MILIQLSNAIYCPPRSSELPFRYSNHLAIIVFSLGRRCKHAAGWLETACNDFILFEAYIQWLRFAFKVLIPRGDARSLQASSYHVYKPVDR